MTPQECIDLAKHIYHKALEAGVTSKKPDLIIALNNESYDIVASLGELAHWKEGRLEIHSDYLGAYDMMELAEINLGDNQDQFAIHDYLSELLDGQIYLWPPGYHTGPETGGPPLLCFWKTA